MVLTTFQTRRIKGQSLNQSHCIFLHHALVCIAGYLKNAEGDSDRNFLVGALSTLRRIWPVILMNIRESEMPNIRSVRFFA